VGIIALGLIGWLAWRYRKNHARTTDDVGNDDRLVRSVDRGYTDHNGSPQELESRNIIVGAEGNTKGYFGGRKYDNSPPPLRELESDRNEVHEMEGLGVER
jgi:hypothetical protein